ncbi:ABC transporter substrate-binding protein [Brockia lithotrophica]|uniref:Peptide/nickel transport system substrate-binding protein n=1 Tax=Brockia lithotrophica TaxID=933949 RepID=A0A660L6R4_9BACL|nr:ABC transporter substrate-binding protein [Brockia lithotrophica]RKQ89118.1 peptide/nickel transport system substrate-binding protein [Brockia lithotrophica]
MRRLWGIFLALVLVMTLSVAGCSKGGPPSSEKKLKPEDLKIGYNPAPDPSKIPAKSKERTDTIILGMQAPQGKFNPAYVDSAYDDYVNSLIFEALGKVDKDGSVVPDVATWEIQDGGKTYVFRLNPEAKFADGTPITARDAEFYFYITLDPTYDGPVNMLSAKIVGAKEYHEDKEGKVKEIRGVQVLDEHTLRVEVEEPLAITINYLTVPLLPKHYYGKDFQKGDLSKVKELLSKPLGSGPYKLEKFVPDQEVRLVANENYWRKDKMPKMKTVIVKPTTQETNLQLLGAGDTDFEEGITVNRDNLEALLDYGFLDINLLLNNGFGYISVNHNNEILKDKRVRQALLYGLDRKAVVQGAFQGFAEVIDVPQTKVSWGYPDEAGLTHYDYNLDKAKQLLEEAGWKMGSDGYRYKDGKKLEFHYVASHPNPVNQVLVPLAKESYKTLGIDLVVDQLDFNAMIEKMNKGDYDLAFLAVGLGNDPDPYSLFHTNGARNKQMYHYSNPEVDKLIDEGRREFDKQKRKEIYNKLYKLLNEEVPILYVYQRYNLNTWNARLTGFDITPFYDFTNSLPQVHVKE